METTKVFLYSANAETFVVFSFIRKRGGTVSYTHLDVYKRQGVANAILLPAVMAYNAPATGEKYREIARAMGVAGTENMTQEQYRQAAIDAVRQLSMDVGIPQDLKSLSLIHISRAMRRS